MERVVLRMAIVDEAKVFLLFDKSSGTLLGLYQLSGNFFIESPQRIWLIDLTFTSGLNGQQKTLAQLLNNVCAN